MKKYNFDFLDNDVDIDRDKKDLYLWGNVLLKLNDSNLKEVLNRIIIAKEAENYSSSNSNIITRIFEGFTNMFKAQKSIELEDDHVLNGLDSKGLSLGGLLAKLKNQGLIDEIALNNMGSDNLRQLVDNLVEKFEINSYDELKDKINSCQMIKFYDEDIFDENGLIKTGEVFMTGHNFYYNYNSESTIRRLLNIDIDPVMSRYCFVPEGIKGINYLNAIKEIYEKFGGNMEGNIKKMYEILDNGQMTSSMFSSDADINDYRVYKKDNLYYINDCRLEDIEGFYPILNYMSVNCANSSQENRGIIFDIIKKSLNYSDL